MPNDVGLEIPELTWENWRPQEPQQGPPLPNFLNIYWPWYTPPAITLSGLIVSPSEVQVGTPVSISCVAFNATSEAATRVVELKVEGETMATQEITLEPGESRTISFEIVPTVAKSYSVSVNGLYGTFKATEVAVADIRVENLVIEHAELLVGEVNTISVTATNYGGAVGTKRITCIVS